MWSLGSRGSLILLAALCLLALFYASWRPVLFLALSLLIVAHTCYSLLVNDSLFSPTLFLQIVPWLELTYKFLTDFSSVAFGLCRDYWWNMKRGYRLSVEPTEAENSPQVGDCLGVTSTPVGTWKGNRNGGLGYGRRERFSEGENRFHSAEGSPWGNSISPRMRNRAAGVKTVQTVAGPLLASTRYNIDPKVYTDVSSPGLTTRLTRYATEMNTKLTHQSRYAAGQFPKVNLHASPTPVINAKIAKAPVTVRVAPPETIRLSSPERKTILTSSCLVEKVAPSVVQVLKDISLKRHASHDDITTEFTKKQRTEMIYHDELGNLEEMTQKRARDDSPKSDEENTTEYRSLRPKKRTKTPSCNDILNSLSSSIQMFSGIKRKAEDCSRGDVESDKHFKSLDQSRSPIGKTPQQKSPEVAPTRKNGDFISLKKPTETAKSIASQKSPKLKSSEVNVADKLFMRASPENNEKLKAMIEERGNVKETFSTDGKDEIRKEDIVNMRQTSMRARLQSMFDAISGKTAAKINEDIVIQAEDVSKDPESAPSSNRACLNSSTSTTNVNTSPITTSAVAPILMKPNSEKSTSAKHVTFDLNPTNSSQNTASGNYTKTLETTKPPGFSVSTSNSEKIPSTTAPSLPKINISAESLAKLPPATTASPAIPQFSFGSSVAPSVTKTTVTSAIPQFSFGNTATTVLSFGSTTVTTAAPSFGITNMSTASSVPKIAQSAVPQFSFGNTTVSTASPSFGSTIVTTSTPSFGSVIGTTATPSFGSTIVTTATPSFGSAIATTTTPSFGNTIAMTATSSFGNTTVTTATSSFGNTTVTTAVPSFGNKIATPAMPTFASVITTATPSFGKISKPEYSFGGKPPNFSFGSSTTSGTISGTMTSTTTSGTTTNLEMNFTSGGNLSFGNLEKTSKQNTLQGISFGNQGTAGGATATIFGNSGTATAFGATSTTTSGSSMFGMTSPIFGGDGQSFGTAKTTAASSFTTNVAPSFGTSVVPPATTTSNIFVAPATTAQHIFGSNSTPYKISTTTTTTTTTIPNIFASVATSPVTTKIFRAPVVPSASTIMFGSSAAPSTTTANIFSTNAVPATTTENIFRIKTTPSTITAYIFNTSAAPSTTMANIFSANAAPSTTAPNIFNTNVVPPTTATNIFTANAAASTTAANIFSANAVPSTTTGNIFNANVTQSTTVGNIFSANAAPSTTTANIFSTNTVPPVTTTTASSPIFSSGGAFKQTPAFGSGGSLSFGGTSNGFPNTTTTATTVAPPPFGVQQSQSFGGTPTNGNGFGGFAFGGSATGGNNAGSAAFQFGSGATKTGGFTFNASPGVPTVNFSAPTVPSGPSFGAQPQNMFSIGTGSTAPRSRTLRDRTRRQR